MAVYARGYRSYDGPMRETAFGAWSIFREGLRMALERRGVRWSLILIALYSCVTAGILYFEFGLQATAEKTGLPISDMLGRLFDLNRQFRIYYRIATPIALLATVLVGAGLVADDLRSRALSLYLVRPIRPLDYMLGKALIIPALMVPLCLVPGMLLYLAVGLWQPPGETWAFLTGNSEIAGRILQYWFVGSLSLTGLMLLLSSRTPRRGLVMGVAAAVLFGGFFVRAIGRQVGGQLGDVLKSFDVISNMKRQFDAAGARHPEWYARWLPPAGAVWIVAVALLLAGLYLTWRRARTVEVGE
jgi:hypothetical protein